MKNIAPILYSWKKLSLISKVIGCVSGTLAIVVAITQLYTLTFSSENDLPPSERVVQDTHKTQLIIERVEVQNLYGVDEPYVVAIIKNTSEVTALNVKVSFETGQMKISKKSDGVREMWHKENLAVGSQKEALIPVAPVSEYMKAVAPEAHYAKLLEFRMPGEKEIPFSIDKKVCGNDFSVIRCNYETRMVPTVARITFESIFSQEITSLQQWFNIYLLNEPDIVRDNS